MSDTPAVPTSPVQGKRILVVEDEFLIQLDIQHILESAGAQIVVAARRVREAMAALDVSEQSGKAFDAAVLDLRLEKDSAKPVADRLGAMRVPFIFLTGEPTGAEEAHAAPVVAKPFDAATLLAALELALTERR